MQFNAVERPEYIVYSSHTLFTAATVLSHDVGAWQFLLVIARRDRCELEIAKNQRDQWAPRGTDLSL